MATKVTRKIVVLFVMSIFLFGFIMPCYADSIWKTDDFDLTDFAGKMSSIFALSRGLVIAAGCIGVAIGGWNCVSGGEEGYKRGIRQVKISIAATAALMLLPWAIEYGIKLGQTYGWKLY